MTTVLDFQEQLRPLNRADYGKLIDAGAFENEHVELLEGFLVRMIPQKPAHGGVIEKLTDELFQARGRDTSLRVRVQLPMAIGDDSEPEPDIAVVVHADHHKEHPTTAKLVVEVAQSSLRVDHQKARVYARAQVPEYWIVDVQRARVEVRRRPGTEGYEQLDTLQGEQILETDAIPSLRLPVRELFTE